MNEKNNSKSDWPVLLFIFVGLPVAFTFTGLWGGALVLVIGTAVLGWDRQHDVPFPTSQNDQSPDANNRISEEQLYELVIKELKVGIKREGLWAKAFSKSQGDNPKAKALYIEYRVQSLKDGIKTKAYLESGKDGVQKPYISTNSVDLIDKHPDTEGITRDVKYQKVGGWLFFLCIQLTILAPLGNLGNLSGEIIDVSSYIETYPQFLAPFNMYKYLTWGFCAYSFYAGLSLWRITNHAVYIAKTFLLFGIAYTIISPVIFYNIPDLPQDYYTAILNEGVKKIIFIFYLAIWYTYLCRSKRVKGTYLSDSLDIPINNTSSLSNRSIFGLILIIPIIGVIATIVIPVLNDKTNNNLVENKKIDSSYSNGTQNETIKNLLIKVENSCNEDASVAILYLTKNNRWLNTGWYSVSAQNSLETNLLTSNKKIYYHALFPNGVIGSESNTDPNAIKRAVISNKFSDYDDVDRDNLTGNIVSYKLYEAYKSYDNYVISLKCNQNTYKKSIVSNRKKVVVSTQKSTYTPQKTYENRKCVIKSVMTDKDYFACGTSPPG